MAQDDAKLFVRGLPDSLTEGLLKQLFEETGGSVLQVNVPRDRETGRPRGIAFVTMGSGAEALNARTTLDGSIHGGRSISVRPYEANPPKREFGAGPASTPGGFGAGAGGRPPESRRFGAGGPGGGNNSDRTLYVGNLPYDCTAQEIEELVASLGLGTVQKVHHPTDMEGRRRGFGFVSLSSPDEAKKAVDGLNSREFKGRRLAVNLAQPKADRPPRSENFGGGGGGGGGGPGFGGFAAPPPPPPPSQRRFEEKKRKPKTAAFDDGGGPPKKAKRGRDERDDDWRKATTFDEDD